MFVNYKGKLLDKANEKLGKKLGLKDNKEEPKVEQKVETPEDIEARKEKVRIARETYQEEMRKQ